MAVWLNADDSNDRSSDVVCQFAGPQSDQPLELSLLLQVDKSPTPALPHSWTMHDERVQLTALPTAVPGIVHVVAVVPPAEDPASDDEVVFSLAANSHLGAPACRVVLRRTVCTIGMALLERRAGAPPLRPPARAALLWHGWRRYSEVSGLKRFTSGKSGNDVIVCRPRLRDPAGNLPTGSLVPGVLSAAWGSCLLVKTGVVRKVREEWDRFQAFLSDRLHPFMSRSEQLLQVQLAGRWTDDEIQAVATAGPSATILGSFLGGDLLQAEPLEQIIQGNTHADRCASAIKQLFTVLRPWYEGSAIQPLGNWYKVFRRAGPDDDQPLKLFGRFDLSVEADRKRYRTPLAWDFSFIERDHLQRHLLGKAGQRDGLLYRLMQWDVRFSLTHGDLHVRNVLADRHNVWVLDFGETGLAPTLFDFAKLEIYIRSWCLRLGPRVKNFEDAAQQFEQLLLDHLTGSEAGLEPIRDLAASLGASPDELHKVAVCIGTIRRYARRYMLGSPDCRDYLAVLYLTVLDNLRFAGNSSGSAENYRLLMQLSWVLEDALSQMAGLTPFPRSRRAADPQRLISRSWLARRGAPGRIRYVIQRPDGAEALGFVAATVGVLQNANHHLDVFDHTLLVIAYLENLLDDPVAGFLDPGALDQRVADDLRRQGIELPAIARPIPPGTKTDISGVASALDAIRDLYRRKLDDEARLALIWAALFHDVGKPATRSVNAHGKKGERIQFIGHEVYGWQLVRDFVGNILREVCPTDGNAMVREEDSADWRCPACGHRRPAGPSDLSRRVEHFVRRHHDHHTLQSALEVNPERLATLQSVVAGQSCAPDKWVTWGKFMDATLADEDYAANVPDFPLLLLHGFADMLACRGPAGTTPLTTIAERDLLLLSFYLQRMPALQQARDQQAGAADSRQFGRSLTKDFDQELGIDGRALGDLLAKVHLWCLGEQARREPLGLPPLERAEALAKARELLREGGK
ncbi:MAG: phosphotransferase [Pirellulales bacterium]